MAKVSSIGTLLVIFLGFFFLSVEPMSLSLQNKKPLQFGADASLLLLVLFSWSSQRLHLISLSLKLGLLMQVILGMEFGKSH